MLHYSAGRLTTADLPDGPYRISVDAVALIPGHRDVAVAGQENDGKWVRTLSDRVLQVQTTRSRHADVQDDATRRVGLPREQEVAR